MRLWCRGAPLALPAPRRTTRLVSAVAVAFGPALMMRRAATWNPGSIHTVFSCPPSLGVLIAVLFVIGLAGIVAIITVGFNPLRRWLIIASVLFAIGTFDGSVIHVRHAPACWLSPRRHRILRQSAPLPAALNDCAETIAFWVDLAVVLVLLFDIDCQTVRRMTQDRVAAGLPA